MNPDDLKHIARHIETEDTSERAFLIRERITQMSLFYADKRFQENKREKPDYKFSEAITKHTPIVNYIKGKLSNLDGFIEDEHRDKIISFFNDFFEKIDSIYNVEGLNIDKLIHLIKQATRSIKQYLGVENLENRKKEKKNQETKILNFNQISNLEGDNKGRWASLMKLGFSNFDKFIEIHVASLYETDQSSVGSDLIKNDFAVIALNIIDDAPETVAVIGFSWLLSTPLSKRLGFKRDPVLESSEIKENNGSTWAQFIDKDGQINKKRFDLFCETGEMPFKSVRAYMPVEEFLKRYLPKDRRGKIMLKSINKEVEASKIKVEKSSALAREKWTDLLLDTIDFTTFIESECVKDVCSVFSLEHKKLLLKFFKDMFDEKIPWQDFRNHQDEELIRAIGEVRKKIEDNLYVEREVVIE